METQKLAGKINDSLGDIEGSLDVLKEILSYEILGINWIIFSLISYFYVQVSIIVYTWYYIKDEYDEYFKIFKENNYAIAIIVAAFWPISLPYFLIKKIIKFIIQLIIGLKNILK